MNKLLVFFFVCLFSGELCAQADSFSLLYEISGGELKQSSYVFGTIHLRDKRVFQLTDSTWYAFNASEVIAGELLFDKKIMKEAAAKEIMMPNGITLQSLLTEEEYQKVRAYAKAVLGWKVILIDRIKPLFTSSLLAEETVKSDMKYPLDIYLQKQGEKKKKQLAGIETIQEQMQAIDVMSLEEQAQLLLEYVNHPTSSEAEVERMVQLYQQQRLIDLYDMVYAELDDKTEAALLTKRNVVMVERMELLMNAKPTFVAIGSAHLPGEQGVLHLLQEKGYKVRAVDPKAKQ